MTDANGSPSPLSIPRLFNRDTTRQAQSHAAHTPLNSCDAPTPPAGHQPDRSPPDAAEPGPNPSQASLSSSLALEEDTSKNIPRPNADAAHAYNLLALDGGGVKGISSLLILQKIMDRVRDIENAANIQQGKTIDPQERRPVDYFDLAAGTSTGGLLALMLFRLEMRCSDVIPQYDKMAKMLFGPKIGNLPLDHLGGFGRFIGDTWLALKALSGHSLYSAKPLEASIDTVVGAFPLDDDDRAKKGGAVLAKPSQGQVFVCATLADLGESILLRNYDPPFPPFPVSVGTKQFNADSVTIKQAALATSAAPTYLPEVEIQGLTFWDGGLLNNNPIVQLWDNRDDLVPENAPTPHVNCIVSLGTSHVEYSNDRRWVKPSVGRLFNTITKTIAFASNTEAKHRDFDRNIRQHNRRNPSDQLAYFRFDASTGKDDISLVEYQKVPLLIEYTQNYLNVAEVERRIEDCAALLANTNGK